MQPKQSKDVQYKENKQFNDVSFYFDVNSPECKSLIESVIVKNGISAEHNYDYFISHISDEMKPVFVYFGDYKGLFAVEWDDNSYQIISEVIAPESERTNLAVKFFEIVFKELKVRKVLVEFATSLRKPLLKEVQKSNVKMHIGSILNHYYTPILYLKEWDSELFGSKFSNLRKAKNRFYRNFKVEVLHGDQLLNIDIKDFELIIKEWKKNRKSTDKAYCDDYLAFFQNKFKGSACHIALKLNDKLCGVCAAWVVPNTNDTIVYYSINLHNYSIPELGDFLTILFLDELKKVGFEYLDFGSSDERLLSYKKKFGIHKQYETLTYYISNKMIDNKIVDKIKIV